MSWQPRVSEPSGNPQAHVGGIVLSLTNVGTVPLRSREPTYYAILTLDDTAGADVVAGASGPCSGPFANAAIRLAPGQTTQGCIPYSVPVGVLSFGFGFGERTVRWDLP